MLSTQNRGSLRYCLVDRKCLNPWVSQQQVAVRSVEQQIIERERPHQRFGERNH